mmetsp:Transcript_41478/g.111002  ORF Transcript_41478/g.111002 Transcript_41478/m.111002 type:complete len:118 (+) Transcript_41478:645-998(+)
MNYAVHSVMYTYYFAMAAKLQWLAVPFAPLITTVQILQMAAGSYITFKSASIHWSQGQDACKVHIYYSYEMITACTIHTFSLHSSSFLGSIRKFSPAHLQSPDQKYSLSIPTHLQCF